MSDAEILDFQEGPDTRHWQSLRHLCAFENNLLSKDLVLMQMLCLAMLRSCPAPHFLPACQQLVRVQYGLSF